MLEYVKGSYADKSIITIYATVNQKSLQRPLTKPPFRKSLNIANKWGYKGGQKPPFLACKFGGVKGVYADGLGLLKVCADKSTIKVPTDLL